MHICFVISGFGQGGAQKQCALLINELAQVQGIKVTLIHSDYGENFDLLNIDNVDIEHMPVSSYYDPKIILQLVRRFQRLKPDIVFSWLHTSDIFCAIARFGAPNAAWVMTERDSHYPDNWRYNLRKRLGRGARHIICNSHAGQRYWSEVGYSVNRLSVVPNISLLDVVQENNPQEANVVLFAGRLEPQKDAIRLAEAFSFASDRSDRSFQIIGDGQLRSKIAKIVEDSGNENLALLPFDPQIIERYKLGVVYVSLSLHEGLPNAIIENIALGNVVVVSRIKEHEELLGVDYPFYVEANDTSEAIFEMIENACSAHSKKEVKPAQGLVSCWTSKEIGNRYLSILQRQTGS